MIRGKYVTEFITEEIKSWAWGPWSRERGGDNQIWAIEREKKKKRERGPVVLGELELKLLVMGREKKSHKMNWMGGREREREMGGHGIIQCIEENRERVSHGGPSEGHDLFAIHHRAAPTTTPQLKAPWGELPSPCTRSLLFSCSPPLIGSVPSTIVRLITSSLWHRVHPLHLPKSHATRKYLTHLLFTPLPLPIDG